MGDWKEYKLKDVAYLTTGFPFDGHKYGKDGLRVVRGDNVTIGSLRWDSEKDKRWSEPFERTPEYSLRADDIVIGMDGSRVGKNRAQVKASDLPLLLAQRVACVRHNELSIQSFLYYQIFNDNFEKYIKAVQTGTSIPHVSLKQIGDYPIMLPPLTVQHKISDILKSLDDKIECNRRINENLEQQAQALFKSWFVDYEPFKDQPFVESELGMIPQGWRVGIVKDLCVTNKRSYKGDFVKEIEYIDTGSVTNNVIDSVQFLNPATDKIPSRARRAVMEGDIIYSSVRPNQRHYALLFNPSANTVVSTGFVVITANWSGYRYFIYQFLIQDEIVDKLQAIAEQSVSTFPSLNASDITNLKIVIPPNDVVGDYSSMYCSFIAKIYENQQESRRLAELRDTLLPKLMSGEINVNEACI